MDAALSLASVWLCCLYVFLHFAEEAPELPWLA